MNEEILQKIKDQKISKEKKWIYTFAKYIISQGEDLDYKKLQNRINVVHHQSQGYFKDYYRNLDDRKKHERVTRTLKRQSSDKLLDKQKKLANEQRKIYRLFKEGDLSNKSTMIIENNIRWKNE